MKKSLLQSIILLSMSIAPAFSQTWVGGTSSDWATDSNWTSPASVPVNNGNVIFGTATSYTPNLTANSANLNSLLFSNANTTNAYTFGGTGIISIVHNGVVTVEATSLVHSVNRLGGFATGTTDFTIDIQGAATNFVVATEFRIEDDFVKNGAGTLTLNSTSNVIANGSSTMTVNGGTVDIRGANLGGIGTGGFTSVSSSVGTVITNSDSTTRNFAIGAGTTTATIAGTITGNLQLQKGRTNNNDPGTQITTGANTYTGITVVNTGTLLVNGSHVGGGSYTVNGRPTAGGGDAILGGNGTINVGSNTITIGDTVASSGIGRLQPGAAANTIGTLNLTAASLVFNPESVFTIDLNTTVSNTIDLVNLTGNLSIGAGATLSLNPLTGFSAATFFDGTSYTFIDYSGSLAGTFSLDAGSSSLLSSNNYEVFYDTANSRVMLQAIPEPSTMALLGSVLAFMTILRRRRTLA